MLKAGNSGASDTISSAFSKTNKANKTPKAIRNIMDKELEMLRLESNLYIFISRDRRYGLPFEYITIRRDDKTAVRPSYQKHFCKNLITYISRIFSDHNGNSDWEFRPDQGSIPYPYVFLFLVCFFQDCHFFYCKLSFHSQHQKHRVAVR